MRLRRRLPTCLPPHNLLGSFLRRRQGVNMVGDLAGLYLHRSASPTLIHGRQAAAICISSSAAQLLVLVLVSSSSPIAEPSKNSPRLPEAAPQCSAHTQPKAAHNSSNTNCVSAQGRVGKSSIPIEAPTHLHLLPTIDSSCCTSLKASRPTLQEHAQLCDRYRHQLSCRPIAITPITTYLISPSPGHGGVYTDDAASILLDIVLLRLGCQQRGCVSIAKSRWLQLSQTLPRRECLCSAVSAAPLLKLSCFCVVQSW
jgi:hypothetical protein